MKRNVRMLVCLSVAGVLSIFLLYSAFAPQTSATPLVEMDDLHRQRHVTRDATVQLVGVARGPIERSGEQLRFKLAARSRPEVVNIQYSGAVPDAFRTGRHVVVSGRLDGNTFRADRDSLVTKCPSKFQGEE